MSWVLALAFLITFEQFSYSLLITSWEIFSQILPSQYWSGLCASITDNFFRSFIYSTILSENVWLERFSTIHFINGLEKIGKAVGVMSHFFISSRVILRTPIKERIQSVKVCSFIHYLDFANFLSLCTKLFFKKVNFE